MNSTRLVGWALLGALCAVFFVMCCECWRKMPMRGIKTEPKPYCPECGAQMRLVHPKEYQDWKPFWGCSQYPDCSGTRNIDEDGEPVYYERETNSR